MRNQFRKILAVTLGLMLLMGTGASKSAQAQGKLQWQADIDWAANDTGAPDCPLLYVPVPDCLATGLFNAGNRACVIGHAIDHAKNNEDLVAFGLVLITQCHSSQERQNLINAGPYAVANYLRTGY
jgi:hypothetical protein